MARMKKFLEAFEDWSSGILVACGLLILFYGVILRYVLGLPTTWQDEIARIFLVWGILIGVASTLRENNHIRVDLFYRLFPKSIQRWIEFFANLVILSFFVFLVYSGSELISQKLHTGQESLNGLPLWFIYLIIPFSGLLLIIRTIEKLILALKGELNGSGDLHQNL